MTTTTKKIDVLQLVPGAAKAKAPDWQKKLLLNDEGKPRRNLANTMTAIALHPAWQGVLAWDDFGFAVVTLKKPPMREQDEPASYATGDWSDEDSSRTAAWLAAVVGFEPATTHVDQAVAAVARKVTIHPVRDFLAALKWDGAPRLDRLAADYLGADDSRYSAAVGSRWMISAVARVFEPGCKVDSLLGLEGVQGIGKSTALRLLASDPWFADTGIVLGDKDSYQALRRKWMFEFAELASIRGRDIERVKSFLSSQVDTYRASYGRRTQDHPRQVVFAGSTNESHYLADPSGARRFWPLKCKIIDLAALKRDRDQLWAEARIRYERGEAWHLDTTELRELASEEQSEREERDDWCDLVERWLESPTCPDGYGGRRAVSISDGLSTADVLVSGLGFSPERVTPAATKRVGHVLRALGFFPRQIRSKENWKVRPRLYFRVTGSDETPAPVTEPVTL